MKPSQLTFKLAPEIADQLLRSAETMKLDAGLTFAVDGEVHYLPVVLLVATVGRRETGSATVCVQFDVHQLVPQESAQQELDRLLKVAEWF